MTPPGPWRRRTRTRPYKPPVVERLTEEVLSVGSDGAATVRLSAAPEPGFEPESGPQPPVTLTVRVTPLGRVLTPQADADTRLLLGAIFRLPAAPVRAGASWVGTALQGEGLVKTSLALAARASGGSQGLVVITQALPQVVAESRSPDHDGTLLQTTRSERTDRIVFDVGAGNLRRATCTMSVTLSLVMTGRGARGAADFGRVVPNVRVMQTMTIERQDDPPVSP